jgi:hypothetical protein
MRKEILALGPVLSAICLMQMSMRPSKDDQLEAVLGGKREVIRLEEADRIDYSRFRLDQNGDSPTPFRWIHSRGQTLKSSTQRASV